MRFEDRSTRSQIAVMRRHAIEVLRHYPIDVRRLRLLNHGYNTTFRVDATDGRRFALRINVNSRRAPAHLAGEIAWLAALAAETDLVVPVPQPDRDGGLIVEVANPVLDRTVPAVLFGWLPGPDLGDGATPRQIRAVGRATATLHTHAEHWALPAGTDLPRIDSILMGTPNHLDADHPALTREARTVIDAAFDQVQQAYDSIFATAMARPLHADLHVWNLKWYRGRLAVFDFDDSGLGAPVQDLAISTYYLRDRDDLVEALFEGYQESRPLPSSTTAQFEAIVAGRNLVLLNDMVVTENAEFRAMADEYIAKSVRKLRRYLEQGTYRHDAEPEP